MFSVIILILAIMFAAMSNAVMDKLQFHFNNSIFPDNDWTNPSKSWDNEYVKSKLLTYLLATILSPFVDLWHLVKFLWLKFMLLSIIIFNFVNWKMLLINISIYPNIISNEIIIYVAIFLLLWVIYSFTFEMFFGIILDKRGLKGYLKKYLKK